MPSHRVILAGVTSTYDPPVCVRPERRHGAAPQDRAGLRPGLAVIRPGRPIGSTSDSIRELRAVPLAYGSNSARLATTFATASTFLDLDVRPRQQRPVPREYSSARARIAQQAAPCELPSSPRLSGGWAAAVLAPAQSLHLPKRESARRARQRASRTRPERRPRRVSSVSSQPASALRGIAVLEAGGPN